MAFGKGKSNFKLDGEERLRAIADKHKLYEVNFMDRRGNLAKDTVGRDHFAFVQLTFTGGHTITVTRAVFEGMDDYEFTLCDIKDVQQ